MKAQLLANWTSHGMFSLSCWMRTQMGKEAECQVIYILYTYSLLWEMGSSVLSLFWGRCSKTTGTGLGLVFQRKDNSLYPVMTSQHTQEYNCALLIQLHLSLALLCAHLVSILSIPKEVYCYQTWLGSKQAECPECHNSRLHQMGVWP